jgi:hypothetical protein
MPLIAQANPHEATAEPHDLGRLLDAIGDEQDPFVEAELLRPFRLQLAQAQGEDLPDRFEILKGRVFTQEEDGVLETHGVFAPSVETIQILAIQSPPRQTPG